MIYVLGNNPITYSEEEYIIFITYHGFNILYIKTYKNQRLFEIA